MLSDSLRVAGIDVGGGRRSRKSGVWGLATALFSHSVPIEFLYALYAIFFEIGIEICRGGRGDPMPPPRPLMNFFVFKGMTLKFFLGELMRIR